MASMVFWTQERLLEWKLPSFANWWKSMMKGWGDLVEKKLPCATIFIPSLSRQSLWSSHWPVQMSALDPTEIRRSRKGTKLHPGCIFVNLKFRLDCISQDITSGFSYLLVLYFSNKEQIFQIWSPSGATCIATFPGIALLVLSVKTVSVSSSTRVTSV